MKTVISKPNSLFQLFYNTTTTLVWKKLKDLLTTGSSGFYLACQSFLPLLFPAPAMGMKKSSRMARALASLEAASLAWIATVKSIMLNRRQYVAFLIFCASPFAFSMHVRFDREVVYEWMGFIENWFHLLNLIGPYLWALVVLLGVSLLIPPTGKTYKIFKWNLSVQNNRMLCVPIGICIAKIIWLSLVDSNEDFWSLPNWPFFSVGIFIGYFTYRLLEYFTWRKFHAYDGIVASLEGLFNSEMDHKTRIEMGKPLWKDLKEFQQKY